MNIHIPMYEHPDRVKKIVSSDTELANIDPSRNDRGRSASRAVMRMVDGVPAGFRYNWGQDSSRVFLPDSGGSIYIDLDHFELAAKETLESTGEFVAVTHAMFRVAQEAARKANAERGEHEQISLVVNNSDGFSNSYGAHLNNLMSRSAYNRVLGIDHETWRPHLLSWLASVQVSSILCTGAGKCGSENGRPEVDYQLAQRVDFYECMAHEQTTRFRPICNLRDECEADGERFARVHNIFFDATLNHTSIALRGGVMSLVLAMIEAGVTPQGLIFEDPLATLHQYSHDPDLKTKARTIDGQSLTILEHQLKLLEEVARFVDEDADVVEYYVPDARRIVELWRRMLHAFQTGDVDLLVRNIDHVAKRMILERAMEKHGWKPGSPQLKLLDQRWGHLDPEVGLYLRLEAAGRTDQLVTPEAVTAAGAEPDANTRSYARAHLLRALLRARDAEGERVKIGLVDWSRALFSRKGAGDFEVDFPDPSAGREATGDLEGLELSEVVERMGGYRIASISKAVKDSSRVLAADAARAERRAGLTGERLINLRDQKTKTHKENQ